jgi:RNA polymerase sigma factor (TIGR02999 family)
MSEPNPDEVTRLLKASGAGDPSAFPRLLPLVYEELRRLARGCLDGERRGHTLQPTALVHEAYLKLVGQKDARFENRGHFFQIAAKAMRRILVDHARTRGREKRGGGRSSVPLDELLLPYEQRGIDVQALEEALEALAELDERKASLVELRYFGGLNMAEAAAALHVPLRTLERDWTLARAWLRGRLSPEEGRA